MRNGRWALRTARIGHRCIKRAWLVERRRSGPSDFAWSRQSFFWRSVDVDFEVLQALGGDWVAVMSTSPENLPNEPQAIHVGFSDDGLEWDIVPTPISPLDMSYLDPTGVPTADGNWLIVMAVAPNAMGDRGYTSSSAILRFP